MARLRGAAVALAVVALHVTVLGREDGAVQSLCGVPGAPAGGVLKQTRVCERAAGATKAARQDGTRNPRKMMGLVWRTATGGVRRSLSLRGGCPAPSGEAGVSPDDSQGTSRPAKHARFASDASAARIAASDPVSSARLPVQRDASAQERLDASFLAAVLDGNDAALPALVEQGARVNAPDAASATKETALHLAASRGLISCVASLLDHGADVHAVDSLGNSPLHDAALHGHTGALAKLVEGGGDLEAANAHGLRPLHCASANGHTATIKAMLALGAHAWPLSTAGATPLRWAAVRGHVSVVGLLLSDPRACAASAPVRMHEVLVAVRGVVSNAQDAGRDARQLLVCLCVWGGGFVVRWVCAHIQRVCVCVCVC